MKRTWTHLIGALLGHDHPRDPGLPQRLFLLVLGLTLFLLAGGACAGSSSDATAGPAPQQPAPAPQPASSAPAPDPEPQRAAARAPVPVARPQPPAPAAETPRYGGSASFYVRSDPRGGLEPHLPGGRREARHIMGLAYETLAAYDTQPGSECAVELRPLLAEGWRFVSPTTVEISLKKGVQFHNKPPVNGREAVAEDVVFSYRRLFDQGLQKLTGENIIGMEAVDRYTVRIRTKEPAPLITQELFARYEALILAKEAGGPEGKFDTLKTVIGTGPFVLQSYTPGVNFVAVRNPDYRVAGRPYLDELRVPIMRDKNTRVAAFQVGKLDYLEDMESDEVEGLAARNTTIRFVPCENPSSYGLMLRNDIRPFNDVRVRRAISMAFDREGIVKGVFRRQGNVRGIAAHFAEGALKPGDFPPEIRKYLEHNPAEARRLVAEAGYPTGLELEVFGSLFHGSPFSQQVEILPAMLRPAGFNVRLVLGDITSYQAAVNSWNYGPAGVMMVSAFPLEELLPQFHSQQGPNNNRPALKDPELDALIGKMLSTIDPKQRQEVMKQIQLRMVDQAYWVAYPTFYSYYGIRPRLKGNLRANALVGAGAEAPRGMMFVDAWVTD